MIILSLGAGVQSTAIMLLSAEGVLPKIDLAIFADTQAEPIAVYEHFDRLVKEVAEPAGIEVRTVTQGSLTERVLNKKRGYPDIPLFVKKPDGTSGMLRRSCTGDFKIAPIKREVRRALGANVNPETGRVGNVPKNVEPATQWIGISTDEFHRAKDSDVPYVKHAFPLLDLGWSRQTCIEYLKDRGWGSTPKSACIYCPFHGNKEWRNIRDNHPEDWQNLLAFDRELRNGKYRLMENVPYLHRSLLPMDEATIDHVTAKEYAEMQGDMFAADDFEMSCSPFSCKADEADYEWVDPKELKA